MPCYFTQAIRLPTAVGNIFWPNNRQIIFFIWLEPGGQGERNNTKIFVESMPLDY